MGSISRLEPLLVNHTQIVHDIVGNYLVSTPLARVLKSEEKQEYQKPDPENTFEVYFSNKMIDYYELGTIKHKTIAYNMCGFLAANKSIFKQLDEDLAWLANELTTTSYNEIYKKWITLQEKRRSPEKREKSYLFAN